jgi:inosose dehydratase
MSMNRREFTQSIALGLAAASVPAWLQAQAKRAVRIGHTGITWPSGAGRGGGRPAGPAAGPGGSAAPATARGAADPGLAPTTPGVRSIDPAAIEQIFQDVSSQGFHGLELFNWQIDAMEPHGGLAPLIEKYKLPLVSSYSGWNMTDATQRPASIAAMVESAKLVKKYGGKVIVFGPNGVNRASYVFAEHKQDILTSLNEGAKRIVDLGLTPVLHQHTGTCIESRDETYAVMEAVDTRLLKFGPDIGQLQKGGSDPVQVVKDFLPLVQHMHLKDFAGGPAFLGYAPLGQGHVDIPAILTMMDGRALSGMIMVELDGGANMPMTALETARIARAYLQKQGVDMGA